MISTQQAKAVSLSSLFQPVMSLLRRLARREARLGDYLEEVGCLLETLPLSSDEFSLSTNRLRNAERYFRLSERGAAQWELNLLRRLLQRCLDQLPVHLLLDRSRSTLSDRLRHAANSAR